MNFNLVVLGGRLTRAPELRYSQGGSEICKFGLAINRKTKTGESTCFVDCTAFGRTAEVIEQYFSQGDPILVRGRLELDQWTDKETGNKRSKHGVIVDQFEFCGGQQKSHNQEPAGAGVEDDDLPF